MLHPACNVITERFKCRALHRPMCLACYLNTNENLLELLTTKKYKHTSGHTEAYLCQQDCSVLHADRMTHDHMPAC